MIEILNVTKKYGEQTVLDNFSLTVNDGEKLNITGESGTGKTTLLRILSGLESVDNGTVVCEKKTAYMFQEARLLPWKTAKENILAVLKKDNYYLADKYLEAICLSDAADKVPSELSGGMAQRVSFARFLAYAEESGADLLLLDEPFSALDKGTADKMLDLLLDFAVDKTVILVTHDADTSEKLGGRVVKL